MHVRQCNLNIHRATENLINYIEYYTEVATFLLYCSHIQNEGKLHNTNTELYKWKRSDMQRLTCPKYDLPQETV